MRPSYIIYILAVALLVVAAAGGSAYGFAAGRVALHNETASLTELLRTYIRNERVRYEEMKDSVGRLADVVGGTASKKDGGQVVVLGDRREREIVAAVERISPAVVSIVVSKDVPKLEVVYENPFGDDPFFRGFGFQVPRYQQKGTERRRIGAGTGFIVSSDGLIVTNKHVAADEEAEYAVLLTSGEQKIARVLARDPKNDIAILKIDAKGLPVAPLGDSDLLRPGQSVIAIGNALGELSNSVSVGIVSGLGRNITAGGAQTVEQLYDVIQTDAAINPGNSGGPLLNLRGEVVGVNVATVQGAQTIGFALPINDVKRRVDQIKKFGRITMPFLGIRYAMITPEIKTQLKFSVDEGAVLVNDTAGALAVVPGSPADKAGLRAGDVIVAVEGNKVTLARPFDFYIKNYDVGDEVRLEVVRNGVRMDVVVTLEELQ